MVLLPVVVFLAAGTPVSAGQGNPNVPVSIRVAVNPSQGNPGDTVQVSGTGADPSSNVVVTLAPQADTAAGALATVTVTSAASGDFSAMLTLPANIQDGIYAVRAEQFTANGNVSQFYWNSFVVGSGGTGGPLLPTAGDVLPVSALTPLIPLMLVLGLMIQGVWAVIRLRER
jgi:hypothetical protein